MLGCVCMNDRSRTSFFFEAVLGRKDTKVSSLVKRKDIGAWRAIFFIFHHMWDLPFVCFHRPHKGHATVLQQVNHWWHRGEPIISGHIPVCLVILLGQLLGEIMAKTLATLWLCHLLPQVWYLCQQLLAVDIIGKDKLVSIFGRFVGDVHPKWTPPSKCQQLFIHSYIFPGHIKLFTVVNEYVPYFSTGSKFVHGLSFPPFVRVIKSQTGKEEQK